MSRENTATKLRVWVKRDSEWSNISNLFDSTPIKQDIIVGAEVACGIDSAMSARVFVERGVNRLSASPEMIGSALNAEYISGAAPNQVFEFNPLFDGHKEIVIQATNFDNPLEFEWDTLFLGRISQVDWENEVMTLTCIGFEGQAEQALIEEDFAIGAGTDRVQASVTTSTLLLRETQNAALTYSNMVNGDTFFVLGFPASLSVNVLNGISLTVQAVPSSGINCNHGQTITTGEGAHEDIVTLVPLVQELNKLLAANSLADGSILELYIPEDPDFALVSFLQTKEYLNQAIQNMVAIFGGTAKETFNPFTGANMMSILTPDQNKATPDGYYTLEDLIKFNQMSINVDDVRNRVRITIEDFENLDSEGQPTDYTIVAEDTDSQERFGIRSGLLEYPAGVVTTDHADDLAEVLLNDLKNGFINAQAILKFDARVDLFDLVNIEPDRMTYDIAKNWGVVGYAHVLMGGNATTTLQLSANVTRRFFYWGYIPGLKKGRTATVLGDRDILNNPGNPRDVDNGKGKGKGKGKTGAYGEGEKGAGSSGGERDRSRPGIGPSQWAKSKLLHEESDNNSSASPVFIAGALTLNEDAQFFKWQDLLAD